MGLGLAGCSVMGAGGALAQNTIEAGLWPAGEELDFGVLESRAEVVDTLWLSNPTEEAFAVEAIRASCGCTAVEWPSEPIAPGATVAIPVAFRCTGGRGEVRRHLDVWLSHLRRPERVYVYAECPRR